MKMQKILFFGLIAVVLSSGIVDACGSKHKCITDFCCNSQQKCENHICTDVECDLPCFDTNFKCAVVNHKPECTCKAGYKLAKDSTTHCELDNNSSNSIIRRIQNIWSGISWISDSF